MKSNKNIGLGIAFGVAAGSAIGASTGNIGLWIAIGIAIGAAVGTGLDKKSKKNNLNNTKSLNRKGQNPQLQQLLP